VRDSILMTAANGVVRGCSDGVLHGRTGIRSAPQVKKKERINPACEVTTIESRRQRNSSAATLQQRGGAYDGPASSSKV
jgi:hypothetical protein